MEELSLFNKEEMILEESRGLLERQKQDLLNRVCQLQAAEDCARFEEIQVLLKSYAKLLDEYGRLYRQSSRLVHMSDRLQRRINETNMALMASQEQLEVRNRFIRNTFGRYISDEVVTSLLDSPKGLELGGEKREVTIMMSDLRGFTSLCEQLSAEIVVTILNMYFEVMVDIVSKYQGTIMGIFGDGLMVIFGAPLMIPDHARRAVACALEMQTVMPLVNERNFAKGLSNQLSMGIGIDTGTVVVGNIGSTKRSKYSVIGNHVNLAARIESLTVGGQVLISEATLTKCGKECLRVDEEMTVNFKGMRHDTSIYLIGAIQGEYNISIPLQRHDFVRLNEPMQVHYTVLDDKKMNGEYLDGRIVALAKEAIALDCHREQELFDNLKIIWSASVEHGSAPISAVAQQNVYGKIVGQTEPGTTVYQVVITAISPEADALLFAKLDQTDRI